MLEASADKQWGGQPDYEQYKRDTPVLVPLGKLCGGDRAKPARD